MARTKKAANGNGGRHLTIEGLPVTDGEGDLYITVSKTDVTRASKKDPAKCAVAKACERVFNTEARVHLGRVYLKNQKQDGWVRYVTPLAMRQNLITYDQGGDFEPRAFRLTPVGPSKHNVGRRQGSDNEKRIGSHSNAGIRMKNHITQNVRQHASLGEARPA